MTLTDTSTNNNTNLVSEQDTTMSARPAELLIGGNAMLETLFMSVDESWKPFYETEIQQPYFAGLMTKVNNEYIHNTCYPEPKNIMRALKLTPLPDVRVVILGQDPYPNEGQATGLAFSVPDGITLPPSLRNIATVLQREYDECMIQPKHGDLSVWGSRGVLLLNTTLTVRAHEPASHSNFGWSMFTDHLISYLNEQEQPIVFMLWGNFARTKKKLLDNPKHLILETTHPSPLSARKGFLSCSHFTQANNFLRENNVAEVNWKNY